MVVEALSWSLKYVRFPWSSYLQEVQAKDHNGSKSGLATHLDSEFYINIIYIFLSLNREWREAVFNTKAFSPALQQGQTNAKMACVPPSLSSSPQLVLLHHLPSQYLPTAPQSNQIHELQEIHSASVDTRFKFCTSGWASQCHEGSLCSWLPVLQLGSPLTISSHMQPAEPLLFLQFGILAAFWFSIIRDLCFSFFPLSWLLLANY